MPPTQMSRCTANIRRVQGRFLASHRTLEELREVIMPGDGWPDDL